MSSTTFHCSQGQFNQYNNVNPFASDAGGYCCPTGSVWNGAQCAAKVERCWNGADDNGDGLVDCEDPTCYLGSDGPIGMSIIMTARLNCTNNFQTTEYCWNGGSWNDECQTGLLKNAHCSNGRNNETIYEDINLCCRAGQEIERVGTQYRCVNVPETICDDGKDNDMDGFADCLDNDCQESPFNMAKKCDDNIIGLYPAADQDGLQFFCAPGAGIHDMCCPVGTTVQQQGGQFICAGASGNEICNDGMDNNWNGLIDCQDPECAIDPAFSVTVADATIKSCMSVNPLQTSEHCAQIPTPTDCIYDGSLGPPPAGTYYCSDGRDGEATVQGINLCCPVGTRALYTPANPILGTDPEWSCTGTTECYKDDLSGTCDYKYDSSFDLWFLSITNDYLTATEWCVAPRQGKACCPVIRFGEYAYYSDTNNVKIY